MNKILRLSIFLIPALFAPGHLRAETPAAPDNGNMSIDCLSVPDEIGRIKERFKGSLPRTVIQIQDVHAHAVAQENIAAILTRLKTVFRVDRAALEGAWISTSLPKSRSLPSSREKQLLARTLMEEALLSGPVYAAILSPSPITLVGIEDETHYEKNRRLYLEHSKVRATIAEKLAVYLDRLKHSQKTLWNPELSAFYKLLDSYYMKGDLSVYLPGALKVSEAHRIDLSDLEQIALVRKITALEKQLERERFEKETKQLLREYKNMPYTLEELIRGGRIPDEKLGFYPEIKKIQALIKLRDSLLTAQLWLELETMAQRIADSLIKNKDENELWQKTRRFYPVQGVLFLEATPDTLVFLEKNLVAVREDMTEAGLSEEFGLSLAFYAAVKERDEIFANKLLTDPSLQGTVAIVTGGFHTEGLSRKFRDAGISYITISPELGDGVFDKLLYEKRLTEPLVTAGQASSVSAAPFTASQTLSELRNRLARADERFPPSLDVLLETKNILTAVGVYKGDVPLSGLKKSASSSYSQGPDSPADVSRKSLALFSAESFIRQSRDSQLAEIRAWMEKSGRADSRAMLAAETEAMKKLLENPVSEALFDRMIEAGDILALAQNRTIDPARLPDRLVFSKGVERFEVRNEDPSLPDIEVLLQGTPRFKRFAQKYPFAIMKSGYANERFVVLPESPAALVLYRLIALDAGLYRAARNPEFVKLLEGLVAEILSSGIVERAA